MFFISSEISSSLLELLKNFIQSQRYIEIAMVFSRTSELIEKFGQLELGEGVSEANYKGEMPLSTIVETLLDRLKKEYKEGHYGSGSFDTPEYRIVYFETGSKGILLCICDFYINLDQLFPIGYLVAEKIAQLLEGTFDLLHNVLTIPRLTFHHDFSLGLEVHESKSKVPVFDHVFQKHHVSRAEKSSRSIKVIILGAEAVGKTTLVNSFLAKEKTEDYRPTIGIAISHQKYNLQGFPENKIDFLLYDLAGQKFFKRVRHQYYEGAQCAVIVYDITRRETFTEAITYWYEDIKKELGNIPIFFLGNKMDLLESREVQKHEGLDAAEKLKGFFLETSARENINVQDAFNFIGIRLHFFQFKK